MIISCNNFPLGTVTQKWNDPVAQLKFPVCSSAQCQDCTVHLLQSKQSKLSLNKKC